MATRTVHESYIDIIGIIWMPAIQCATRLYLSDWDVGNMQTLDREGVEIWMTTNTGDFQSITDFRADIWNHYDKCDVVVEWADPESEYTFNDLMYPSEEDEDDPEYN